MNRAIRMGSTFILDSDGPPLEPWPNLRRMSAIGTYRTSWRFAPQSVSSSKADQLDADPGWIREFHPTGQAQPRSSRLRGAIERGSVVLGIFASEPQSTETWWNSTAKV
jgi:hypothetical protein